MRNQSKSFRRFVVGLGLIASFVVVFSMSSFGAKATRLGLDEKTKGQLLEVYGENERLHRAFYDANQGDISKFAKTLEKKMSKISDDDISKLLSYSRTKLKEISSTNDLATSRQNFHLVSLALIHVLGKYDLGGEYNAYSCPMVKKKWIQNSKKLAQIHNPYSPEMPHCGSKDSRY